MSAKELWRRSNVAIMPAPLGFAQRLNMAVHRGLTGGYTYGLGDGFDHLVKTFAVLKGLLFHAGGKFSRENILQVTSLKIVERRPRQNAR